MGTNVNQLLDFYKKEISSYIAEARTFDGKEQFTRIASLFAPGKFYYWILNFANLEMEYVSNGSTEVLGMPANEVSASSFLALLSPKELKAMSRKEAMVVDFLKNHIPSDELTNYKIVYLIQLTNLAGESRTILHQATTLTVDESGQIEHVLSAHTDVSHLKLINRHEVSFIHLRDGISYYNLPSGSGKFELPNTSNLKTPALREILSQREIEILKALTEGLSKQETADKLFVSPHTVQTHHKNMLAKTGCHKMTDLIIRALLEGID